MTPLVVGFDLDMTLLDTRPGIIATFDALNAELGTSIDGQLIAANLGPRLESAMADYFPAHEIDPACDRFRELYVDFGPQGSSLLPGAAAAIEAVRAREGTTLVVTAKFEPNAHRCLDHVGLAIDHVVGWRHGPQKAETLRVHGAQVYVGDTVPDIDAARAAGAHAVGVPSGPRSAAELTSAGADVVLESLLEFPAWLAATLD